MTLLLTADKITNLIKSIGIDHVYQRLISQMRLDYEHWSEFQHMARICASSPHGVIELMPSYNQSHYTFKYVNGHPNNPKDNLPAVCAFGCLSSMDNGIPLLIADMTLLTAIRTACCSAMVYDGLKSDQEKINVAIIGTGAQSEFQITALHHIHPIDTVYYVDIDQNAMVKFEKNLKSYPFNMVPMEQDAPIPKDCDVVVTATTCLLSQCLKPSMLTNDKRLVVLAIGGDGAHKSELSHELIEQAHVIIEYLPQTKIEGEIKQAQPRHIQTIPELFKQPSLAQQSKLCIFDSVGFALEDFSTLMVCYQLMKDHGTSDFFKPTIDPKNLFGEIL